MKRDHLVCTACGTDVGIETVPSTCPACDGILDVRLAAQDAAEPGVGLWAWSARLPHCSPANRITLGEGGTPLLSCPRLGAALGLTDLRVKNDALQPTGSFKDRALALAASLARHYGRKGLVLSSSGNAGASAAAYAARAGLPAVVIVPATAAPAKLAQIRVAGARLVTVDGPTSACCALARRLAAEDGWVNATTTFHFPYGVDAYATIAYELAPFAPDVVVLPISSGPILAGVMKGFAALHAEGRIAAVPRPIAVQPTGCAPTVRAFVEGGSVRPWAHRPTVAGALNDTLEGYERDGDYTIAWVEAYGGTCIAVDDAAILDAVAMLARLEGIVVEPSAAAPVAALASALAAGAVKGGERVVAVATGHGLKDLPAAVLPPLPAPVGVDARSVETLVAALNPAPVTSR